MSFEPDRGKRLETLLARVRRSGGVSKGEPPSASSLTAAPFLIGKNSRGNWVVQDPSGLRGGLFVDRTQALKFAMSENGSRCRAVIMVPDGLELDMTAKPRIGGRSAENLSPSQAWRRTE